MEKVKGEYVRCKLSQSMEEDKEKANKGRNIKSAYILYLGYK